VNRDCIGCRRSEPSGTTKSQREIDVFAIEQDAFVEPTHFFPRSAAIGSTGACRACEHGEPRRCFRDRPPAEPREPGERLVHGQPYAVDRPLAGLDKHGRDRRDKGTSPEWRDQPLEEVRARLDVVVEENNDVGGPGRGSTVACDREAEILRELEQLNLREVVSYPFSRLIRRGVVNDDHLVRYGLIPQPAEASAGEIPPLEGGNHDVDREAHPRLEAGVGAMHPAIRSLMSRILVISFSDLASDPRVDRQIAALKTRHSVIAAGLSPPRQDVEAFIDLSGWPTRLTNRALGLVRLLLRQYDSVYWRHPRNVAALERLVDIPADVVIANELEALPLALRLGPPVVFDAHEYSPAEHAESATWRLVFSRYARWLCRRYIPRAAAMTTVGQAIADAYEQDTGVRAVVVVNAPPYADLEPKPTHEPIRILHHGGALAGRGLEEMVGAAELLDERFVVDFVLVEGLPGYRDKLVQLAGANPRVRFPPPRPMHELVQMANDYDVGLYSLQPLNFNNRYALPNKFFEFVQARLAVAIGPSPEIARLVKRFECGVIAEDFSREAVAASINALDHATIDAFKRASHVAARELCAERTAPLVLDAVESALAHSARSG
jgi:hypothetical protein